MRLTNSVNPTEVNAEESDELFDVRLIESLLPQLAQIAKNSIARQWQAKVSASDIVQETFVEASKSLPSFSGSTIGEFAKWLQAILTNNISDTRRKYVGAQMRAVHRETSLQGLPTQDLPAPDSLPCKIAEANEFDRELHLAIQSLGLIDNRIVKMRYQRNMTFAQIGENLAMKEDTVRKRWNRILIDLQRRLKNFDSLAESCPC